MCAVIETNRTSRLVGLISFIACLLVLIASLSALLRVYVSYLHLIGNRRQQNAPRDGVATLMMDAVYFMLIPLRG